MQISTSEHDVVVCDKAMLLQRTIRKRQVNFKIYNLKAAESYKSNEDKMNCNFREEADDQECFFLQRVFDNFECGLRFIIWPRLKATSGENKYFSGCMELE